MIAAPALSPEVRARRLSASLTLLYAARRRGAPLAELIQLRRQARRYMEDQKAGQP